MQTMVAGSWPVVAAGVDARPYLAMAAAAAIVAIATRFVAPSEPTDGLGGAGPEPRAALSPSPIIRRADEAPAPRDRVNELPCFDVAPPDGVYTYASCAFPLADGRCWNARTLRVAVVGGCAAAEVGPGDRHLVRVASLAPGASGRELVLQEGTVPVVSVAIPPRTLHATGDRLVLEESTWPTPFDRHRDRNDFARRFVELEPKRIVAATHTQLLEHPEPVVQAAALVRLLRDPLTWATCDALDRWLARTPVADSLGAYAWSHGPVDLLLRHAGDRCLLPAIRRLLPGDRVAAGPAFVRLATADEKAAAALDLLDTTPATGSWTTQTLVVLVTYLHPDHCGPTDRSRCLLDADAARFEVALRDHLRWTDPHATWARALHVLHAYLGDDQFARRAPVILDGAPCAAVTGVVTRVRSVPPEQMRAIFEPALARRDCRDERELSLHVLAHQIHDALVEPEDAWELFGEHLDAVRGDAARAQLVASLTQRGGCVYAKRVRSAAARAVVGRLVIPHCPPP